jgi:hypothetical protein
MLKMKTSKLSECKKLKIAQQRYVYKEVRKLKLLICFVIHLLFRASLLH